MKLKDLLNDGINNLKNANVKDSVIQARVLLCYILKIDRNDLIKNSEKIVETDLENSYKMGIKKIINGRPLQYITNNQEFMKLNFYVDESVLIPQPDTEILVEEVLTYIKGIQENEDKTIKILDLCTGSGAIAISIAKYSEQVEICASDISIKALQVAKLNAEKNGVRTKINFIESDMFKKINLNEFDIIVSNPPYIKTKVIRTLDMQVQNEPHLALDGGRDGLTFYKIIANKSFEYLNNEGKLFLEIGYDQKKEVIELLENTGNYNNINVIKDLENNDRVIIADVKK